MSDRNFFAELRRRNVDFQVFGEAPKPAREARAFPGKLTARCLSLILVWHSRQLR
jgi:hypothetical protein